MLNKLLDKVNIAAMAYHSWYRQRTINRLIQSGELDKEWEMEKTEIEKGRMELVLSSPHVITLAEEAAKILDGAGARNYFSFEMLPWSRPDLRPVKVTIQWVNGMSPEQKNIKLEQENEQLRGEIEVLEAQVSDSKAVWKEFAIQDMWVKFDTRKPDEGDVIAVATGGALGYYSGIYQTDKSGKMAFIHHADTNEPILRVCSFYWWLPLKSPVAA